MHPGLEWYLSLSAVLFVIGLIGVLTRRNVLVIFMCVEMMLNAVNISFIAFGRAISSATGQVFALFVITVAAAEAAVGLGDCHCARPPAGHRGRWADRYIARLSSAPTPGTFKG